MKPPRRIQIGPHRYRVNVDPREHNDICRAERGDLLGHADHAALLISIDVNQAKGQMRDTLLHEVLHGLADLTGLARQWGSDEEDTIRRLTPALLDVLRRNPTLVAYLTD